MRSSTYLTFLPSLSPLIHAQTMESLVTTAAQIAQAMKLSLPNPSLVLVAQPYYWWQSGIVNNALLSYGFVTGDSQFQDLAKNTIYSQATAANDFMMPDATGNDDQAWWALSALTAAENGVPVPAGAPTFLSMAQNVFNEQKARWDESTCGGGLRFKINAGDAGYDYKSSIANGLFFQLAARLAKFTSDADARAWAEKSYTWVASAGLIDADFNVYDGVDAASGCAEPNPKQWSYNAGAFLYGAAVMASQTGDATWAARTQGFLSAAQRTFVRGDALFEPVCEDQGTCNNDQVSFKGILARWMGATAVEVPALKDAIAGTLGAVSAQVQRNWTPGWGPMQQFVALESVDAAIRANGGLAAAYGMIGGSKNVVERRSVAGRIVWDA
jgi:mannan endo-1,6-alpha-mannosidase